MSELENDDSDIMEPAAQAGSDEMTDEAIWKEMTGLKPGAKPDADPEEPGPDDVPEDESETGEDPEPKEGAKDDADTDHDDPESLRAQIEKLTQQVRSEKGRARGLNMKYERLQSDLREAKSELEALRSAEVDDSIKEKLTKAREEYGDVLDPVLERMDRRDEADRRLAAARQGRVDALSREQGEFLQEQFRTFQSEHPTGVEYLQKNHAEFSAWVQDQPKSDRDIFEQNRQHIVDGEAAALLLSKFKAHKAAAGRGENRPDQTPSNASRRQRQLAGARSVRANSSQVVTSDNTPSEDDPEALFNHFVSKKRR